MTQDRNVDDNLFNPQVVFEGEFAEKRLAIVEDEHEALSKHKINDGAEHGGNDLISAFNSCWSPEYFLLKAGYKKKGGNFRHPNSTSGSYGALVKDNRVSSFNENDPLNSNGRGSHDAFGAFCVFFHNGNINAALKDAGDNWLKVGDESFNKVKQREYALANKPTAEEMFPDGIELAVSNTKEASN